MSLVAAVLEPADGIGPADEVHRSADRRVERIVRAGAELLQDCLQLAPAELDRVQVRRVRRQVQDRSASRRDEAPDVRRLVGPDVVEDDDVARPQRARDEREQTRADDGHPADRKSTRLNSSHITISYAVFCLKKKKNKKTEITQRNNNKTTYPNNYR